MAGRIGSDLRRARERREISLGEVETATRIRVRYLRAIEEEDWEELPGGVYSRGFIRTYAGYLGLDGERLAADFSAEVEGAPPGRGPAPELAPVAASTATGSPGGRRSVGYLRWLAIPMVLAVAAAAIFLIPGDGGKRRSGGHAGGAGQAKPARGAASRGPVPEPKPSGVEVRLTAEAEVWVCLVDGKGTPLVEGQVLEAGAEEGPFRSGSFSFSLGNGEVTMLIDGKQAEIAQTSGPIGYAVDSDGRLRELEESERPTCT
jgi:Helix-turn-helix domain